MDTLVSRNFSDRRPPITVPYLPFNIHQIIEEYINISMHACYHFLFNNLVHYIDLIRVCLVNSDLSHKKKNGKTQQFGELFCSDPSNQVFLIQDSILSNHINSHVFFQYSQFYSGKRTKAKPLAGAEQGKGREIMPYVRPFYGFSQR